MTWTVQDHHPTTQAIYKYFDYDHLPRTGLWEQSRKFHSLATALLYDTPPGPETTACLRKLLEAKDCAVRALL